MNKQAYTLFLIVSVAISLFYVLPVQASQPSFGMDGQANSSIPLIPITNSNDSNYAFMANGTYQAYFKNNSKTSNSVRFQYLGYTFDMDISTSQLHWYNSTLNAIIGMVQEMNPQNTVANTSEGSSVLTYYGAWINTDLQYQAFQDQLKETLIIHNVSAPSSSIKPDYLQYAANCYFNNSLTIYANGVGYLHPTNQKFVTSGRINFNDANNQTVFWLPQPSIQDSNDSSIMGIYAVTANNGILIINIRVPKTFLDNAVFPVYLDPTALDGSVLAASSGAVINLIFSTSSDNDVMIVAVGTKSSGGTPLRTVSSISSNVSTSSWTKRTSKSQTYATISYQGVEEWYATWTSHGAINVTVTLSGTPTNGGGVAFGISGADTTTIFDSNAGANPTNASGLSPFDKYPSVLINTSNANNMIIGVETDVSAVAATVGSGYTKIQTGAYIQTEYKIVSATQSNLPVNFTLPFAYPWCIIADAVMQASAGQNLTFNGSITFSLSEASSKHITFSQYGLIPLVISPAHVPNWAFTVYKSILFSLASASDRINAFSVANTIALAFTTGTQTHETMLEQGNIPMQFLIKFEHPSVTFTQYGNIPFHFSLESLSKIVPSIFTLYGIFAIHFSPSFSNTYPFMAPYGSTGRSPIVWIAAGAIFGSLIVGSLIITYRRREDEE